MTALQKIQDSPVYKQIMADSYGGIMYNVDNEYQGRQHLIDLWDGMTAAEREHAGGIVTGAINFLKETEV